jgi:hypothetical protein
MLEHERSENRITMVKADTKFATHYNKPNPQDAGTLPFGNRITMVEADKMFATNYNKPVNKS